jgi:hypothetical protein
MTIRDHMHPIVGGLGRKIERPVEEKPDVQVSPGVFRGADGRLYTVLPEPPIVSPGPWPFPISRGDKP